MNPRDPHHDQAHDALLAWIEGARDANGAAQPPVGEPDEIARAREMRHDAAALASLPTEPAPDGLVEAAMRASEPAREREALLGLSEGEPITPYQTLRPAKHVFPVGRIVRPLAMAAALLLVASAGVWGVLQLVSAVRSIQWNTGSPTQPDQLASNADDAERPAPIQAPEPMGQPDAAPDQQPGATLASAAGAEADATPMMELSRAARLAREGRLVIRIGALDTDRALARLERRIDDSMDLSPAVPSRLARALIQPPARSFEESRGPDPAILADNDGSDLSAPPTLDLPERSRATRPDPIVRLVVLRPTEDDLRALLDHFADDTRHLVLLEEAAEPMLDPTPPPTRQTVLWWTMPPEEWGERVRAPLVIEAW